MNETENRPLPHSMRLVRSLDQLRMDIQTNVLDVAYAELPAEHIVAIENAVHSIGESFNQFYRDRFNIPRV